MTAHKPDGHTITKSTDGHVRRLEVHMPHHQLSWRNHGSPATAYLLATSHDKAQWLTLNATEAPNKGPKRTTIVTLDAPSARALYDQLHAVFV